MEEVRVGDVDEHEVPPRVEEVGFLNWLESMPFGESCRHLGGPRAGKMHGHDCWRYADES